MGRQFMLYTQKPKVKTVGVGVLTVGKEGVAFLFSTLGAPGSRILADMARARLDFAGSDGIMLSGMERAGVDRNGHEKYVYQEWWLAYTD